MEIINQFIIQRITTGIVICNYKQSIHYEFKSNYCAEYLNNQKHGMAYRYAEEMRYIGNKMRYVKVCTDNIPYAHGLVNGTCISYYPDNKLQFVGNYTNGKKHGICKYYYRDGIFANSVPYVDGLVHGNVAVYNDPKKPSYTILQFSAMEPRIDSTDLPTSYVFVKTGNYYRGIRHGECIEENDAVDNKIYLTVNNYHYGLLHGQKYRLEINMNKNPHTVKQISIKKYYYGELVSADGITSAYW